jgi:hypothetical protein
MYRRWFCESTSTSSHLINTIPKIIVLSMQNRETILKTSSKDSRGVNRGIIMKSIFEIGQSFDSNHNIIESTQSY